MKAYVIAFVLIASPAAAQSFGNYQAQVERAISELNLHWEQCRVNGVEVNEGPLLDQFCSHLVALDDQMKGRVHLRAAYYINQLNPTLGLLVKTGGANISGFSTDLLIERGTGWFVDTLTTACCENGQRYAVPRWAVNPPDANTSDPARWRPPTRELAGLGDVVTPPPPPPPPPPPGDISQWERSMLDAVRQISVDVAGIKTEIAEARKFFNTALGNFVEFAMKYILPAIGGWVIGAEVAK